MSNSTSTSKKKKIKLNGKVYHYGDTSHLQPMQIAHVLGKIDVYAEIPQDNGEPLPSLADQWKEDFKRRMNNGKSSSRR